MLLNYIVVRDCFALFFYLNYQYLLELMQTFVFPSFCWFVYRFLQATEAMLQKDIADNKAIGTHGATAILSNVQGESPVRVLTHCNTGSLATAG